MKKMGSNRDQKACRPVQDLKKNRCVNYACKELYFFPVPQRYTYRVLRTIQMKLILLCVWADQVVLGSAKTALKFNYEILIGSNLYNSMYKAGYTLEK